MKKERGEWTEFGSFYFFPYRGYNFESEITDPGRLEPDRINRDGFP
jgi:hypothetical protein